MVSSHAVNWVLRIAVAGEFFGHGVLAVQGKPAWIEWFSLFGVSDPILASQLLTAIGTLDILLSILVLFLPVPLALLWMAKIE